MDRSSNRLFAVGASFKRGNTWLADQPSVKRGQYAIPHLPSQLSTVLLRAAGYPAAAAPLAPAATGAFALAGARSRRSYASARRRRCGTSSRFDSSFTGGLGQAVLARAGHHELSPPPQFGRVRAPSAEARASHPT